MMIYISTKLNQQLLMSWGFYPDIVKLNNFHSGSVPPRAYHLPYCICVVTYILTQDLVMLPRKRVRPNQGNPNSHVLYVNLMLLITDGCGRWTHTKCGDVHVSNDEYNNLIELDDLAWFCPACDLGNFGDSFFLTSDNMEYNVQHVYESVHHSWWKSGLKLTSKF